LQEEITRHTLVRRGRKGSGTLEDRTLTRDASKDFLKKRRRPRVLFERGKGKKWEKTPEKKCPFWVRLDIFVKRSISPERKKCRPLKAKKEKGGLYPPRRQKVPSARRGQKLARTQTEDRKKKKPGRLQEERGTSKSEERK